MARPGITSRGSREITTSNAGQLKADWMTELNHSAEAAKYSGEADADGVQRGALLRDWGR